MSTSSRTDTDGVSIGETTAMSTSDRSSTWPDATDPKT